MAANRGGLKVSSKKCRKCDETKPLEAFHRHANTKGGRRHECATCTQEYHREMRKKHGRNFYRKYALKRHYKMTLQDYEGLLALQDGRCAICNTSDPQGPWGTFTVDHDHKTGEVRGLLCQLCNQGLGDFKDNVEFLASAIRYLTKRGETIKCVSE